jgi:hypothetical protein
MFDESTEIENFFAYGTLISEDIMEEISGCRFVLCAWDGAHKAEIKEETR